MIRLKNIGRRPFFCDITDVVEKEKSAPRILENKKTGVRGIVFHQYNEYQNLSIMPGKISEELDYSILENPSVSSALKDKRLTKIEEY